MKKPAKDLSGCRVLIVSGTHEGQEGICLGPAPVGKKWAVSPDDSEAIVNLQFEKEFGLLVDLAGDSQRN